METIAPTATVETGATVGIGTRIWDFVHVRSGASLGAGCIVGRNAFIDAGVIVGDRCKIQNNALLYAPAVLADGVFIGPSAILTNDRIPRAVTPDLSIKEADGWKHDGVTVGVGASIGAGAVIVAGVRVGAWAIVAAAPLPRPTFPTMHWWPGSRPVRPLDRQGWADRSNTGLTGSGTARETGDRFRLSGTTLDRVP